MFGVGSSVCGVWCLVCVVLVFGILMFCVVCCLSFVVCVWCLVLIVFDCPDFVRTVLFDV